MAYTVEKKIFSDALSDTYDVVDKDTNIHYNLTEYYSDGNLTQTDIAAERYLSLYRRLWTLKNVSLTYLPKIFHVESTNNITIIWENLYGISLKDYLETYNTRISYRALLNVLPPLLDDCETAHQNGIYFNISPETIFITDGGILKLNTMVNPSANIYTANMGIARCVFFMLTGFPYGNVQIPIGVYIPNPLWQLLYGVLTWRVEFGSIGEFHNAIRQAIRASENEDFQAPQNPALGERKKNSGTVAAAGIGFGCFGIILLVLIFAIVWAAKFPAQVSTDGLTIPAPSEMPQEGAGNSPFQSVSFEYAYYNPDNENEIFNGMVAQTDAGLFYRRKSGGTAQLVKEAGNKQTVLLDNVFPAFIQSDGESVYFCDGYNEYYIYGYDGTTVKQLVKKTSGYLRLYKNYLYYIDDEDEGSIYRLNTRTNEITKINDSASYDLTVIGSVLYYVNIYDDYAIYFIDMENGEPSGEPLLLPDGGKAYGYDLKDLRGNLLYCKDTDRQLRIITPQRVEMPFIYPVSAYMYDVYGDVLYYLDDENYILHELLITGGGKDTVVSTEECSYITAVNNGAFFISDGFGYALCKNLNNNREIVDIINP